jgi:hypothetical protein
MQMMLVFEILSLIIIAETMYSLKSTMQENSVMHKELTVVPIISEAGTSTNSLNERKVVGK